MSYLKNYASAAMGSVKEEPMVLDLDDILMGTEQITEPDQSNLSNMQQFGNGNDNDDDVMEGEIDHGYMMLLDSFRGVWKKDNPLRSIRYEVDNGGYDKREFKRVFNKQREGLVTETKNHVDSDDKEEEEAIVLDECYKSHLKWLVENSKRSHEKVVRVKREEVEMSLSDSDSDTIEVHDRPFLDDEDSPFVPSKNYEVIDLEEESGECVQPNSWFKKEIMKILKEPFDEEEYKELYEEAKMPRVKTKCRELRDGRELSYVTDELGPSYLDMYTKFTRMLEKARLKEDHHKALNLLRGFIFYLTKVACNDAFKPWRSPECLKIRCS